MKILKNIIIIGLAIIAMSFNAKSQSFEKVKTAISIASAKEVATYFDSNVEITIDGKTANYSKIQGEFVLKDFFKKNPVSGFNIIHNGNSQGGLIYAIGKYSSSGKSYRALIRMRNEKLYNLSFTLE